MESGQPGSRGEAAEAAEIGELSQMVAGLPRLSLVEIGELLSSLGSLGSREAAGSDPRQRLVEAELRVVLAEAEARASETVPVEDLFQEGSAALVTVVHGLDPGRPMSAPEFGRRVRQAVGQVMDGLLDEDAEARKEDARWAADAERLFLAEAELRLESRAEASDPELAAHLGWPMERVAQLRQAVAEARSQHDEDLLEVLGEMEDQ